ncbi:MFS transporter-like protein Fmp42 [Mollisia scopiformis]|uniref:MFS transporter-like protein Fmp42 n=1 Tax=Mollisia scopiformis TaxID=149040 RepID=A0A194XR35_MOLSC|nr:MFS transporter-like protein Fmp42 [Mollisia scopiformis]KUJ22750.1 MFS transporter-like protein Fmp42 [Mollisia scopiformis]
MSLLHRVTSYESLSPPRGRSPVGSHENPRDRKLSFSPLPGSWDPPAAEEHTHAIGAFEVPKSKRILQVAISVFYCLFAAGIVFGYAAIKPVLIRERVYRDYCTKDELERGVRTCFDQEIHLNLMFTIAAVGTNVAALPIGAILDHFGPRLCGILGSFLLAIGAVFFSFAYKLPFDGYIPGYLFLALGGPFIFISSFQLSNTFPKHSGLILALLTGAFDSSSAIFLLYRMLYQWSNNTFTPHKFFLLYLIVPAFILLVQILIMPQSSYKTVGELVRQVEDTTDDNVLDDQMDEHTALLRDERRQHRQSIVSDITSLLGSKSGAKHLQKEEVKNRISGVWGAMHGKTVRQQITSPWFILVTLFTVIQMTRINYFVATIRPQYEYLLSSFTKAVEINTFFDIALPLGGILSIPFIGLILDNTSTLTVLSLLVTIATTIGILGCLPYTWAAYANVCLFVLYRPFYYTAVSDYSAKVFGFRTFGTVYGFIICLAGLFNFTQSGLDALLHKVCKGNPVPVNVGLLSAAAVVGIALCVFVGWKAYYFRRDRLEEEAEHAGETLMPGARMPEGL